MPFTCAIHHDTSIGSRFRCFQTSRVSRLTLVLCLKFEGMLFLAWNCRRCQHVVWEEMVNHGVFGYYLEGKFMERYVKILLKGEQPKATRKLCRPTVLLLMVNRKGNNTRIHFNHTSSIRTMGGVYMLVCYYSDYSVFRLLLTGIKTSSSRKKGVKKGFLCEVSDWWDDGGNPGRRFDLFWNPQGFLLGRWWHSWNNLTSYCSNPFLQVEWVFFGCLKSDTFHRGIWSSRECFFQKQTKESRHE